VRDTKGKGEKWQGLGLKRLKGSVDQGHGDGRPHSNIPEEESKGKNCVVGGGKPKYPPLGGHKGGGRSKKVK